MSPGISAILSWQLGEVDIQATHVKTDSTVFDELALALKNDADRILDSMSGESIEAARRLGCDVEDDGTVSGPPGMSPSNVERMEGHADAITSALRSIRTSDRQAAELLGRLYGAQAPAQPVAPNYSDNWGPNSSIAGTVISAHTDTLAALLKEDAGRLGADAFGDAALAGKALGPLGNAAGLYIGVIDRPEGESLTDAMVAEGGGVVASLAAGAATGAILGSWFPGIGTAAGAVIGAGAAGLSGYLASGGIRTIQDDQRAVKFERGEA